MLLIPKSNIPNQKFGVTINDFDVEITLKTARKLTLFSLRKSEEYICHNVRCVPNSFIFFQSLFDLNGMFYWRCPDGSYPHYTLFDTQDLLFVFNGEIK